MFEAKLIEKFKNTATIDNESAMTQINKILNEVLIYSNHMVPSQLSHYIDPSVIYTFMHRYGLTTQGSILYREFAHFFSNIWGRDYVNVLLKNPTFINTVQSPHLFYNKNK